MSRSRGDAKTRRSGLPPSLLALGCGLLLSLAGCPQKHVARPYPPPTAAELLRHLRERAARIHSVRADSKVDDLAENGDRIKAGMSLLVESPDHLRMDAEATFVGAVASLATDGKEFQLLDVRHNRFLAGEASPCNIGRLIRVELRPSDVVAVVEGGVPLLDTDNIEVGWDDHDGGREVLTLRAESGPDAGKVETIKLRAKDRTWDVVEAELRGADDTVQWHLASDDFDTVDGERMPGKTTIEQPRRKADARIRYKSRELNVAAPPNAFRLEPPTGIPVDPVHCE